MSYHENEKDFTPLPEPIQEQPLLSPGNSEHSDNEKGKDSLLGYMDKIQELVIRQQADIREQLRGTEEPNVYFIYDKLTNEKLYQVQEDSKTWCQQQLCGSTRSFTLKIFDKFKRELIQLRRPMAICDDSCASCLSCCSGRDKVEVFVRNYKNISFNWIKVGLIKQVWSPMYPKFEVYDENDDQKYVIKGPMSIANCYYDKLFQILSTRTGQNVGYIKNDWNGLCREVTSDTDLFSLKFSESSLDKIDPKMKATMLGGLFLIDFKYFEGTNWSPCCLCLGCCIGCATVPACL